MCSEQANQGQVNPGLRNLHFIHKGRKVYFTSRKWSLTIAFWLVLPFPALLCCKLAFTAAPELEFRNTIIAVIHRLLHTNKLSPENTDTGLLTLCTTPNWSYPFPFCLPKWNYSVVSELNTWLCSCLCPCVGFIIPVSAVWNLLLPSFCLPCLILLVAFLSLQPFF